MCRPEEVQDFRQWEPQGEQPIVDILDTNNKLLSFAYNTLFSNLPYNIFKYRHTTFERKVRSAIVDCNPDVVHFDAAHVACYAPLVKRLAPHALRVLRCHNAEHVILERLAMMEGNPLKRRLLGVHAKRLRAYEAKIISDFDLVLAITDVDAKRFAELDPACAERIVVIPAGAVVPPKLPSAPAASESPIRILHVAAMDWLPNRDGLKWFMAEVLPRLDASGLNYHMDVVGKSMPDEFLRLSHPRVTVHGFLPDLTSVTKTAHLAVVPLRIGGGMRVKIVDYWSMGIPVIATNVGAEGLVSREAKELVIADEASDFAASIIKLTKDTEARESIRRLAFERANLMYSWPKVIENTVRHFEARRACHE
jgi:glycosyltransferase involved in cell wall biosynthesis